MPARHCVRKDELTARMMGSGDLNLHIQVVTRDGEVIGRTIKKIKRFRNLGGSERLTMPVPSVG